MISNNNLSMTFNQKFALIAVSCFLILFLFSSQWNKSFAQETEPFQEKVFTHHMTPEEELLKGEIGKSFVPTTPPTGPVYNVAEFNRMQAVLIRYPFGISYQVIKEMSEDTKVVTIVASTTQQSTVLNSYISNNVNVANCLFLIAPSDSYWTRDYGPWFVFDANGAPGIVDFPYNRPNRPNDDDIPVKVAQYLGINLYGMNVIHTGGNYMTDGMGISSSSDLVWTENPTLTHAQINTMFQNYLGINTYHVVPDPNNTYIDHIDCWGKFLDVDKVLIRSVPTSHAQYDEIEATAAYYASQTSSLPGFQGLHTQRPTLYKFIDFK
jgi:agmatine/peptidylarginine deiminase